MAKDSGGGGIKIDPSLKKYLIIPIVILVGLLWLVLPLGGQFLCTVSGGRIEFACGLAKTGLFSPRDERTQSVYRDDVRETRHVAAGMIPQARERQVVRRERYAAPPRLQPARKRLVNGPRERGSADEFCFSKYPHWRKLMAQRDDCDIRVGHASGGTTCKIKCGG